MIPGAECAVCQSCGSALVNLDNGKNNMENQSSLRLDNAGGSLSCKFCDGMQERDSLNQGSSRPPRTAMISPTTSFSSSDTSTLSCSGFSAKENSHDRINQEEHTMYTSKEDSNHVTSGHILSDAPVGIIDRSHMTVSTTTNASTDIENSAGIEIKPVKSTQELYETSLSFADELDALTWDLPEPDDPEADVEGSVANNDDDEEVCCSGTDWGRSSSLSRTPVEGSESCKFKEEMKNAIADVVTGKMKPIVVQLLRSIGIESSVEDGESWVDIVTSLSWEAASFLKPDAIGGKGTGLDGHVKVKCIASGTRNESRVVRGLVFKKHAAHKHMPTQYKNPRLLLIQGVLGQSSDGLSSFDAMTLQGDAHLRTVIEMIEMSQPNVILVEKTVSRDVQESIFRKGMTLVLDMKLHRLERIALCTGSSIVSTDTSATLKLKQCDSFYFEKFVEEHANLGEGGKRPTKTLMFLEGCPKRLGCTILLMGGRSVELKAIKSVIRYSVLMAYHLILETSFLIDQRSMFCTIASLATSNSSENYVHSPTSKSPDLYSPCLEEAASVIGTPVIDVPISDGFQNEVLPNANKELLAYSPLSYEPYNPVIFTGFSSLSASLKKVVGDSFPLASTYPSLSAYFGLTRNEPNGQGVSSVSLPANTEEVGANEIEVKDINDGQNQSSISSPKMHSETGTEEKVENLTKNDNNVNTVVNSESILVLMSRRNTKGIICEQSHFSRITFYRDFDIPLGKFLQNNILNQRSECSTCGELPEAHHYFYAHHNKQLTIQVKRLLDGKRLPGEREGKLWMWSRCGKCKPANGVPKSTKRVLISSPARVLSLGKFLELSFSQTLSSIGISSCGHSFPRDFLLFFGLGPVVAMFRYSPVTTYTVSTPPQKLEFNYSFDSERLMKEIDRVRMKWVMVFKEVESSLKMIKSKLEVSSPHRSLLMDFVDIDEMLKKEYQDFDVNFQNSLKNGNPGKAVYKPLNMNRLLWEILLEGYIWDQRLNSLLSHDLTTAASLSLGKAAEERSDSNVNDASGRENTGSDSGSNGFPEKEIQIEDNDDQFAATENVVTPKVSSDQELLPRQDSILTDDLQQSESNVSLVSQSSFLSDLKNSNGWFWKPYNELRQIYMNDIRRGYFPRTEPLSSTAIYLPNVRQLISDEGSRLHVCLSGVDDDEAFIVSDHDGELSSIIACALALLKDQPSTKDTLTDDNEENIHNLIRNPSVSSTQIYSNGSVDSGEATPSRLSSFDGLALLDSLLPPENFKAEVSMGVTKSLVKGKYTVVCVYENDFRDLRSQCCLSEIDYIASLSRCRNWDAKGGKSKSFFAKTLDERLIIKEIKKTEFDSFEQFAPHYFKYMKQSFESKNQTCLAKILGIYQVTIRQPKSGKEVKHDLMVMENITYGRNITRQYDLKGALHARFNTITDGEDVLLDQNFVNDMNTSPLYVSNKAKHVLQRAVWNDTSFLNVINVMDYSLLVGVDSQKRELVCGIIDYLRQYTWDKQLETWVKSSLVPKNVLPTVISPREYKKRFRKFMSAHFLCVPDHWCSDSEDSSNSCQICGADDDNSSKAKSVTRVDN